MQSFAQIYSRDYGGYDRGHFCQVKEADITFCSAPQHLATHCHDNCGDASTSAVRDVACVPQQVGGRCLDETENSDEDARSKQLRTATNAFNDK